jgi:hypothetical protein
VPNIRDHCHYAIPAQRQPTQPGIGVVLCHKVSTVVALYPRAGGDTGRARVIDDQSGLIQAMKSWNRYI